MKSQTEDKDVDLFPRTFDVPRTFFIYILSVLLILTAFVTPLSALRVETSVTDDSLRGVKVDLELTLVSTGVSQEAEAPLGRSSVKLGESVDLGELTEVPDRPAQLRVELPDETFYHTVSPGELESGTINLEVHPQTNQGEPQLEEHNMLVQPFPKRMMVREILVIRNSTNARIGGNQQPLQIPLPEGAQRFNPGPGFGSESDYQFRDGQLRYRVSLAPGRTVVGFFYIISTDDDPYTMLREIAYPTGRFVLNTMTGEQVSVDVTGLESVGSGTAQSRSESRQFVGENFSPGDRVKVVWEGLEDMEMPAMGPGMESPGSPPSSSASPSTPPLNSETSRPSSFSSVSWPVFLGIGISLLIFAGAYGYVQFSVRQRQDGIEEFLIEEIARLDQEFEDGAIEKPYYRRTRRRWKSEAQRHQHESTSSPDSENE